MHCAHQIIETRCRPTKPPSPPLLLLRDAQPFSVSSNPAYCGSAKKATLNILQQSEHERDLSNSSFYIENWSRGSIIFVANIKWPADRYRARDCDGFLRIAAELLDTNVRLKGGNARI